jgi:hypothetical protein
MVFLALGEGYFGGLVVGDDGVFHIYIRLWAMVTQVAVT